jgi:acyl-coenzyme A synthetase/AMP-(fatty) acid ligase
MATIQFSEGTDAPVPLLQRKQLLNNIVDGLAKTKPSALYAEIPISLTTYEAGFRKITYRMLANAINGVAWWLKEELGISQNFETLSYIGPSDVQYVIMLLGAVKAGYKVRV